MNDPPREAAAEGGGSRDVNRRLRDMNEALLVSSVRQHELTDQAKRAEKAAHAGEVRAQKAEAAAHLLTEKSLQAESLIQCQKDSLEMVVKGEPIEAVLDFMARSMESQGQGRFLMAIHLMEADGFHFGFVAAPSLPAVYAQATRGMDARLELGTCSSAVMSHMPTVVPDFTDALVQTRWPAFSASVLEMGLSGCFTTPIVSSNQRVLGTFAIYYREPRDLNPRDRLLADLLTSTVALAIERRTAERNLLQSEERYRSLVSIITDVPWTTDPRGAFVTPQPEWMDYTGQTFEESREFGWADALHPDDRKHIVDTWEHARDATAFYNSRGRLWNAATNQYRYVEAGATPLLNPDGRVREWIGTCTDVHEQRQAAEEYQALLGRIVPMAATLGRARDLISIYRAVLEFIRTSMPCSGFFVSVFDAGTSTRHAAYVWGEGEEVDISQLPPMPLIRKGGGANSRAVFEKRTIIVNNYWDDMKNRPHVVIHENGIDPMSSLIVPMMIKDNVLGTLEVQAHENGALNQEHAVALEMAANLAAVAIENVRLIETEATAREAAETANRAKDDFLSVLSHELRTPLNAILGWVRMLKAGVLDEENSERALEVIERNTRLQSSLIEDLLDVSRIISGKMRIETEVVDLVSVVEKVSETIQPLADAKGVSYRFSCEDETVFLTADAVRLQQVVSNLLQNAIKFTPAGGSIEISLERSETNAVLRVKDTGVGIERDLLPHIFDRFRQADASARRNFTGLGLGLTIVLNIVELHGGAIHVDSDGTDRGATFTLTLPVASDFYRNLNLADKKRNSPDGALAGKRILLVDDDKENVMPLKIFLENEMAEVTPASSALEALKHLAEREFHLMITDIGMPEIDGYELVARLRSDVNARNATVKAIALTAYASVDDRERVLGSGFQAHLAKPVNFDELLATIKKISQNGK